MNRRELAACFVVLLLPAQIARAIDGSWNKIRYQAGTVNAKVNPFDWNTTLKVLPNTIEITFAGSETVRIAARSVTALSRGDTAYRRVSETLDLTSSRPVPLFGIVRNSKDHLIGIEFRNADSSLGALLLMVHKDSYETLLKTLSDLTGQSVDGAP